MLIDTDKCYWNVLYKGKVSIEDGAQASEREETKPEPYRPVKCEAVALTIGPPQPVPPASYTPLTCLLHASYTPLTRLLH
jgi:hypothetical protein